MTLAVTGELLVGATDVRGSAGSFRAYAPTLGVPLEPAFGAASTVDVERACQLAADAFASYARTSAEQRAHLLDAIAGELAAIGDVARERMVAETGMPRLGAERALACSVNVMRSFAELLRHESRAGADPVRTIPVGPVAIAYADAFPYPALVASHATGAALAAGCPVVVRSHEALPGTGELQGRAIRSAIAKAGMHEGAFSLLAGAGAFELLIDHPAIRAAAYTGGSIGRGLLGRAEQHGAPIAFFTTPMRTNPIFVLPDALNARAEALGRGIVDHLLADLFFPSTRPGLVITTNGDGFIDLRDCLATALSDVPAVTFPTPSIRDRYVEAISSNPWEPIAEGAAAKRPTDGQARLFETSAATLLSTGHDANALFGPALVLVRCESASDLVAIADGLGDPDSSVVWMTEQDSSLGSRLLPVLARRSAHLRVCRPSARSSAPERTFKLEQPVLRLSLARFRRAISYDGVPEE
jgi:2,5-dioxopentanoate dehydrogenase